MVAGVAGACAAFLAAVVVLGVAWWRRNHWRRVERDYKRIQLQMDLLESNVRHECKQAFAELQTDMTDLTGDLVPLNIPYRPLAPYVVRVMFRDEEQAALQIFDGRYTTGFEEYIFDSS